MRILDISVLCRACLRNLGLLNSPLPNLPLYKACLAVKFPILPWLRYWCLTPLPGLGNDSSKAISLCYLLTVLNYPTTNSWHPFCGWHLNLYSLQWLPFINDQLLIAPIWVCNLIEGKLDTHTFHRGWEHRTQPALGKWGVQTQNE